MKKKLLLFIAIIMSINCFAKFIVMGVDVDCSVSEAINRFENIGFKRVKDSNVVKGVYLGRSVAVWFTLDNKTNEVGRVGAYVLYTNDKPGYPSWNLMKKDMLYISSKLKDMYGAEEVISQFKFNSPYKEGDGKEFEAICAEKTDIYSAFFPSKDGVFIIKLYPTSVSTDQMFILIDFGSGKNGLSHPN